MPDLNNYTIRMANPGDAGAIAQHRASMFLDMGHISSAEYESLRQASEQWIVGPLTNQQYVGWLMEDGSRIIAGGGILIRDQFPAPGCYKTGQWAHIMNVYTSPEYRRRGLARRILQTMLSWCAAEGMDQITLAASEEGRPLYESLGFKQTAEMKYTKL
jgi:GNAT superfamily N-acetyltransferase